MRLNNMEYDTKTKRDLTRLFNLLNEYDAHIKTVYLNKIPQRERDHNIVEHVERITKAVSLIQNNIGVYK